MEVKRKELTPSQKAYNRKRGKMRRKNKSAKQRLLNNHDVEEQNQQKQPEKLTNETCLEQTENNAAAMVDDKIRSTRFVWNTDAKTSLCKATADTVYEDRSIHLRCAECQHDEYLHDEISEHQMKKKDFELLAFCPDINFNMKLETKLTSLLQSVRNSSGMGNNNDLTTLMGKGDELMLMFPRQLEHTVIPRDFPLDMHLSKYCLRAARILIALNTKFTISPMREQILEMIKGNQVIIINGESGCGKTTQVPQYILNQCIEEKRGSACHVICTQPRKTYAISAAKRVKAEREFCELPPAAERGRKARQEQDKGSVGYDVGLDSSPPRKQGSILYCTPEVLLQKIMRDPFVSSASHIIIDDVHVRDIDTDFLLLVVKHVLELSMLVRTDLRVILMSATVDTDTLVNYFSGCPVLEVPGRAHSVQEVFLEQLLSMMDLKPLRSEFTTSEHQRRTPKKDNCNNIGNTYQGYVDSLKRGPLRSKDIMRLQTMDFSVTPYGLIVHTLSYICSKTEPTEAILVFLPDWREVEELKMKLSKDREFENRKRFFIVTAHSKMSTISLKDIFEKPSNPRIRKIIIATDIVETSLTITDIVHVIDTGKANKARYDAIMGYSTLSSCWVSKASLAQRLSRAGRIQPGTCYRLFTKQHLKSFEESTTPEIMVRPLEKLCLMVKVLQVGNIWPFLLRAINPPPHAAFKAATKKLIQMKAMDEEENLTVLGYCLAHLPVSPSIGRMIVFGTLFSCLDPILSIATCIEGRDSSELLKSTELGCSADHSQLKDQNTLSGSKLKLPEKRMNDFSNEFKSDHISRMKVFHRWERLKSDKVAPADDAKASGIRNAFSFSANLVAKNQLTEQLHEIGLIPENNAKAPICNVNSHNMSVIKAVLCAGLYPNVAVVQPISEDENKLNLLKSKLQKWRKKDQKGPDSTIARKIAPAFFTEQQKKIIKCVPQLHIHPSSFALKYLDKCAQLLLYTELVKTEPEYYIFDVTTVSFFAILLFGGHMELDGDNIKVDGLCFRGSQETIKIIGDVRNQFDPILSEMIKHFKNVRSATSRSQRLHGNIIRTVVEMITDADPKPVKVPETANDSPSIPNKVPRLSINEEESNFNCDMEVSDDENAVEDDAWEMLEQCEEEENQVGPSTSAIEQDETDEHEQLDEPEEGQPSNYTWKPPEEEPTNYTWNASSASSSSKMIDRGLGSLLI